MYSYLALCLSKRKCTDVLWLCSKENDGSHGSRIRAAARMRLTDPGVHIDDGEIHHGADRIHDSPPRVKGNRKIPLKSIVILRSLLDQVYRKKIEKPSLQWFINPKILGRVDIEYETYSQ